MKTIQAMISVCVAVIPALAQSDSLISLSGAVETPAGIVVTIKNNHSAPLTAYLISSRLFDGAKLRMQAHRYMDNYVNSGTDQPIAPGDRRVVLIVSADMAKHFKYDIEFDGAPFADGTRTGSQSGLSVLIGRRQRLARILDQYETTVREAWASGGRMAALERVNFQREADRADDRVQHLDVALASVDELVPHWLERATGPGTAVCDESCSDVIFQRLLKGFTTWKQQVAIGLKEVTKP